LGLVEHRARTQEEPSAVAGKFTMHANLNFQNLAMRDGMFDKL
jgi:hypothetical protein